MRCGDWSSIPGEGSTYYIHTVGLRLPRPLPFGSWGRASLSSGRRAHVGTTRCTASMHGSTGRFRWTYPWFRSRRPPGRWRIAPVCRFAAEFILPTAVMESLSVDRSSTEGLMLWGGVDVGSRWTHITDEYRTGMLLSHWCPKTHW